MAIASEIGREGEPFLSKEVCGIWERVVIYLLRTQNRCNPLSGAAAGSDSRVSSIRHEFEDRQWLIWSRVDLGEVNPRPEVAREKCFAGAA
jgi:hypothetical protein